MLLLHFVTSVAFFSNNAAVFDRQSSNIQDYVHPDDQTQPFEMTPGFKPFTIKYC